MGNGADSALSAWLGLDIPVEIAALPRTLRSDLARAALADEQPALALDLAAPDAGPDGPVWAWDVTAAALLALGRADEALARVDARLARAPSIAAVRLRAEALLALGDRDGALAAVRDLTARQPDAVSAWGAAGDVALTVGQVAEAQAAFERAQALSPAGSVGVMGLARLRLAAGDAAGACALLEPLAAEGGAATLDAYALALAAAGDTTRAGAVRARLAGRRATLRAGWRARVEAVVCPPDLPPDEAEDVLEARGPNAPAAFPDNGAAASGEPARPLAARRAGSDGASTGAPLAGAAPLTRHGSDGGPVVTAAQDEPAPAPALLRALREYFGFEAFRPGQAAVCQAMLDGRDTLAVMPTGAGKSLCYQLPAMLLDGVTVVVSPLVALMKDQLDGLPPAVYERATLVNSTLDATEIARRLEGVAAGAFRLLYLAPERLAQPALVAALRRARVARLVVDEAHCVSAWGHDFRPDYLTIGDALARFGDPPLLALTATASPAVQADVAAALGRRLDVLQTPLFRPNLRYEVQRLPNAEAKMTALIALCQSEPGSIVVYVNSRERTEVLARVLRRHGVRAAHYHAGLVPDERARVQDAFMLDRTRVIVATVAFGMGVDKANIRLVVHFSLPESLEAYVQESGRAGRDGRPARCVLLTAASDKAALTRWLRAERLTLDDLRAVYRDVRKRLAGAALGLVDERGLGSALGDDEGAETRGRVALSLLERAGLLHRLGVVPDQVVIEPPLERALPGLATEAVGAPTAPGPESRVTRLLAGGRQTYDALALAADLDLPPSELEPWLLEAREAGRLRYRRLGQGLAVRLLPAPADAPARLAGLLADYAAHQDRRIAQIVGYAEATTCRHARICAHFGQRLDPPCGACDRCAPDAVDGPLAGREMQSGARAGQTTAGTSAPTAGTAMPAAAVLALVAEAPFALTRTGLTLVLTGSVTAPLSADRTRHFGVLQGARRTAVEALIERLVADGYLAREPQATRDGRELNVLVLTPQGRAGPQPWDAPLAPAVRATATDRTGAASPAGGPRQGTSGAGADADDAYDRDCFERLRAWRLQQARDERIAPFMVFSDATLRALAAVPPGALDRATLARVPGIGPAKLARYGEALLALLGTD